MILQALTEYYHTMLDKGLAPPPGWCMAKAVLAVQLGADGSVYELSSLKSEQLRGKKTVLRPQELRVPMQEKRSVNIAPNFLCDNATYFFGVDLKGKPQRALEYFAAAKALHLRVLQEVDTPAANGVTAFWNTWDPAQAAEHPALQEAWDALLEGGNLVFWCDGVPVLEDPAVRAAWQQYYTSREIGPEMQCLVTGQPAHIPPIHPAIKGVKGAQATGAALISFNASSLNSYDREQNLNAPVGDDAVFAYTTALNLLLAQRNHVQIIGDTTVVCWAVGGETAYQDLMTDILGGGLSNQEDVEERVEAALSHLAKGEPVDWEDARLYPDTRFYVLGLAPNAARLSVRFFLQNTFGSFMETIRRHFADLAIIQPYGGGTVHTPMWKLLQETVRDKKDTPSPQMSGAVLRAILEGTPYPATLLNGAAIRIRAKHDISAGQAAIIKAYYIRNRNIDCPEEVLQVSLNQECQHVPYTLGRIFSVLEDIQKHASPGVNTTVKDKYFNSAASTPATIFPLLFSLAQKHLRKLDVRQKTLYNKQLCALSEYIGDQFPVRMNLPEQGAFQLGYYHQTQQRYVKKEEE